MFSFYFCVFIFMKNIEDIDVWREYSKNIKKLPNDSHAVVLKHSTWHQNFSCPKFVPEKKFFSKQKHMQIAKCQSEQEKTYDSADFHKNLDFLSIEELTKKEKRKIRVEATIDLHGQRPQNVHLILKNFCFKCLNNKVKSILIISGKGSGSIKQEVTNWIFSNKMIVAKYSPIKDSKNEVGSFYVFLRRQDKNQRYT